MHRHPVLTLRRSVAALAAASLLIAAPGAAAMSVSASIEDPAGDAPSGAVDIVGVEVDYNRSKGVISAVLTTAAPIDASAAGAAFAVVFGERRNGKCSSKKTRASFELDGAFGDPDPTVGLLYGKKKAGKPREGTGQLSGNTYALRVRHSSFKNLKADCVLALTATLGAKPEALDETSGADRLR